LFSEGVTRRWIETEYKRVGRKLFVNSVYVFVCAYVCHSRTMSLRRSEKESVSFAV